MSEFHKRSGAHKVVPIGVRRSKHKTQTKAKEEYAARPRRLFSVGILKFRHAIPIVVTIDLVTTVVVVVATITAATGVRAIGTFCATPRTFRSVRGTTIAAAARTVGTTTVAVVPNVRQQSQSRSTCCWLQEQLLGLSTVTWLPSVSNTVAATPGILSQQQQGYELSGSIADAIVENYYCEDKDQIQIQIIEIQIIQIQIEQYSLSCYRSSSKRFFG